MKKYIPAFLVILAVLTVISVFALNAFEKDSQATSKNQKDQELQPTSSMAITQDQEKKENEKVVLSLFFADQQATKLMVEKRFVQKSNAKDVQDTAELAMKELVKGPISGTLTNPMPKGAKTPNVKVKKGTANVDISKDFVQKHVGGSTAEMLTVYSIVNTMTSINGITQVQFTVDGKKVPQFKGHMEFDKPFKGNFQ